MSETLPRVGKRVPLTAGHSNNRVPRNNKGYELDFGALDMKDTVFRKLSYSIPSKLCNAEINYKILKLVDSLGILDRDELLPLIKNTMAKNEFERMSEFLDRFSNKEGKILFLLETLCNLDTDLKNVSQIIRDTISQDFPGAVRERRGSKRKVEESYENDKENSPTEEAKRSRSSLDLSDSGCCPPKMIRKAARKISIKKKPKLVNLPCNKAPTQPIGENQSQTCSQVTSHATEAMHTSHPCNVSQGCCKCVTIPMDAEVNGLDDLGMANVTEATDLLENRLHEESTEETISCWGFCKRHFKKVAAIAGVVACTCVACIYVVTKAMADDDGNLSVANSNLDDVTPPFYVNPTNPPLAVRTIFSFNDAVGNDTIISSFG